MPRLSGRTVVPGDLSDRQRLELGKFLYTIHSRIFSGVSEQHFIERVLAPPALRTAVRLFMGPGGSVIGYCAMHTYERRADGRHVLALRGEAGLLPEYRGRGATYGFGMMYALREKLAHPFTPVWYLGTLVHTSSYHLFCKYFPRIYPHPEKGFPEPYKSIAVELISSYADPPAGDDPLVRDVGWITIETPAERELKLDRGRNDVRFFVERNPGYPQGHGLVVIAPISLSNILAAIAARIGELALSALHLKRPRL